jgi:type IV secretion system protein VirD4
VFKLIQDLLEPSDTKGKSRFQVLIGRLPPEHKARWFAGAALNTSEQAMASVLSTVLSRLNAFLDTELEQTICFDSPLDAESFASKKSAIFLVLPEEDQTKNFMAGLMIQNLSRELFSVADENGGKLKNRVVLFCDEFGTMPPFDVLSLFSAGRSRKLTMLPIIQSLAQLEKNYGKEGSEIIQDNCQDTIFGGFAPNSQTADVLSRALGSYTVQSGSISRSKGENSQSLQMAERALMTPDELKSIPKGEFVVMKTGSHPMRTRLRLFLDWGITFGEPYQAPEHGQRRVYYAGRQELEQAIQNRYFLAPPEEEKVRPPQEGRTGQKGNRRDRQQRQAGQPLATIPNSMKKQDGPPPGEGG